ncbi:MAG: MBL fold metallo-hydrolase [Theionarchaea archaeon]|nr:MBL fold metallo-hydrolase [Theionarchaea archaeon]
MNERKTNIEKGFRSQRNPFYPQGLGVGYITVEEKTIYHADDTDFIPEMKELKNIDGALLSTGETYTMDNAEGAEAAVAFNPAIAIPMHTWENNTTEFKNTVESQSSTKVPYQILRIAEDRGDNCEKKLFISNDTDHLMFRIPSGEQSFAAG